MKKLTRLFSFSGRVKRAKFLQFVPLALILWLAAAWVDETWLAPNLCEINENWICYLPGEVREIFREWLLRYYPGKVRHVLNLVRDLLGGEMVVESEVGAGTRFIVTLPCVAPAEKTAR